MRSSVEAVCLHLEAVTFGEINRLLINVPPGFMKSLLVMAHLGGRGPWLVGPVIGMVLRQRRSGISQQARPTSLGNRSPGGLSRWARRIR
jgi:hypothetical protein